MTQITELSTISDLSSSDEVLLNSNRNGALYRATMQAVSDYVLSQLNQSNSFPTTINQNLTVNGQFAVTQDASFNKLAAELIQNSKVNLNIADSGITEALNPTLYNANYIFLQQAFNAQFLLASQFGFVGDNVANNDDAWDRMMAYIGRVPTNSFAAPYETTQNGRSWVVLFPKGKYRINTAKVWDKSGITLMGVCKENTELVFVDGLKMGVAGTNTRSIAINNYMRELTVSSAVLNKAIIDMDCTTFCSLKNVDIYNRFNTTGTQRAYGLRLNNGQWEHFEDVRIYGCSKAGLIIDSDINNTSGGAENWSDTNVFNRVTIVMGTAVNNENCGAVMLTNSQANNNTTWHAVHHFTNCKFQVYFPEKGGTVTGFSTTAIFHDGTITETLIDSTFTFKDCFFENWMYVLDTLNTTHYIFIDGCRYYGNGKGVFAIREQNSKGRLTLRDFNVLGCKDIFEGTSNVVIEGNLIFQDNGLGFSKNKIFPSGRSYNAKGARLLIAGSEIPLKDNTFSQVALSGVSVNIRTGLYKNWERFSILLNDVSIDVATNLRIEIQHSDTTWVTSGYQSRCTKNGAISVTSSIGLIVGESTGLTANQPITGAIELMLSHTDNTFVVSGNLMTSVNAYAITGKISTGSNFITGFRILTNNGTSTFNGGNISLRCE